MRLPLIVCVCFCFYNLILKAVGPFTYPPNLRIETKHDELTGTRRVQITVNGAATTSWWALVSCLNCDQPVYATRTTTPAGPVARKSISSIDDPSVNPRNDDFAVVFNGKLLVSAGQQFIIIAAILNLLTCQVN